MRVLDAGFEVSGIKLLPIEILAEKKTGNEKDENSFQMVA